MSPASQGGAPFGPEVSWPGGYSDREYPAGDYRYSAPQTAQPPAAGHGAHPYAAFTGSGYGDDGYADPGYQGPGAQDAGIAGSRTVQGYVDSGRGRQGYPPAGYAGSSYLPPAPAVTSRQPGYAGSSYTAGDIGPAYPSASSAPSAQHGADLYSQPWDYDQPLRYDGEEVSYQDYGRAEARGGHGDDGAVRYQPPAYDPAAYNGSDYSMPGINGPGYDLSGIIGTSDFEAVGYDEPSYGRLSYDDPRYDEGPRRPQPAQRFEETRFDMKRYEEQRLDSLWRAGEDVRRESGPGGFGNGGTGETRARPESPQLPGGGRRSRAPETRTDLRALAQTGAKTRFDMRALAEPGDSTRFDVPRYDETRLDNLRGASPAMGRELRRSGALMVAPAPARPRDWSDEGSFDNFADLDLTDEPVPAAYSRTTERRDSRPLELAPGQDDDTGTRRTGGKRRGRSGDGRQWMALGAIAVVAASAITAVVIRSVFTGPSGPTHTIVAPQTVDGYTRSANLENQLNVAGYAQTVAKESGGQATGLAYGVYEQGGGSVTSGGSAQMFMFVGGRLTGSDPSASIQNFEQKYPGGTTVAPGSLGGQEACSETRANGQSASMCVWFDNDTFGAMMSPTMTTAKLATTMNAVRPSLELYQK
jgi:hypothetical protein